MLPVGKFDTDFFCIDMRTKKAIRLKVSDQDALRIREILTDELKEFELDSARSGRRRLIFTIICSLLLGLGLLIWLIVLNGTFPFSTALARIFSFT